MTSDSKTAARSRSTERSRERRAHDARRFGAAAAFAVGLALTTFGPFGCSAGDADLVYALHDDAVYFPPSIDRVRAERLARGLERLGIVAADGVVFRTRLYWSQTSEAMLLPVASDAAGSPETTALVTRIEEYFKADGPDHMNLAVWPSDERFKRR